VFPCHKYPIPNQAAGIIAKADATEIKTDLPDLERNRLAIDCLTLISNQTRINPGLSLDVRRPHIVDDNCKTNVVRLSRSLDGHVGLRDVDGDPQT
jgi:hypothetical protein